jgi:hypothetical protein
VLRAGARREADNKGDMKEFRVRGVQTIPGSPTAICCLPECGVNAVDHSGVCGVDCRVRVDASAHQRSSP